MEIDLYAVFLCIDYNGECFEGLYPTLEQSVSYVDGTERFLTCSHYEVRHITAFGSEGRVVYTRGKTNG